MPKTVHHWLTNSPIICLFLDVDGTLAPFTLNPEDSHIPDTTLHLIKNLQTVGVPVAIITGRNLAQARRMLTLSGVPLDLPIGATHGLEIAFSLDINPSMAGFIQAELPLIIAQIEKQCQSLHLTHCLVEKKPYSVALHYRQQPELVDNAEKIMQRTVQNFPNWQLKAGKFVWEIMPKGVDKGQAVTAIFRHFRQDYPTPLLPIFIGDDVSDEAGFLAVQAAGGIGIKVGQPRDFSYANFFVQDIDEVVQILDRIYQYYRPPMSQPLTQLSPIHPKGPTL